MGKVKLGAPSKNSISHFSHPHPLELITTHHIKQGLPSSSLSCSACKLQLISGSSFYACNTCSFSLHVDCFKMHREITHPCHKQHVFTLLPKAPYPLGLFTCDACGEQGDGFSYHCNTCGLDLHVPCAVLPPSITHRSHHHPLQIVFPTPLSLTQVFSCDICKNLGQGNLWKYRCHSCDFDAHLNCTQLHSQSTQQTSAQTANPSASRIAPQQHHPQQFNRPPLQNLITPNMNPVNLQGINNGVGNNAARQNLELMRAYIENYSRLYREQMQQQAAMGGVGGAGLSQAGNYGGGVGGSFPGLDSYGGGGAGTATQGGGGSGVEGLDFLQALNGGGGLGGGDDYYQRLLNGGGSSGGGGLDQYLQLLNAGGSGGGGGGLDPYLQLLNAGGTGGGTGGGLDYLQAFTGSGGGGGGGGGAAILQALMGGGGGGGVGNLSNILGGDGGASMINTLAGLFGGLNF